MTDIATTTAANHRGRVNRRGRAEAGAAKESDPVTDPNKAPDVGTSGQHVKTTGTRAKPDAMAKTNSSNLSKARTPVGETGLPKPKNAPTAPATRRPQTKSAVVLKMLRSARGASMTEMTKATGWQVHSVRGFLSGTVRKRHGFTVTSAVGKNGVRRYRIADETGA